MLLQQIVLLITICCVNRTITRSMQTQTIIKSTNQMPPYTNSRWRPTTTYDNAREEDNQRKMAYDLPRYAKRRDQNDLKATIKASDIKLREDSATETYISFLKRYRKSLLQQYKNQHERSTIEEAAQKLRHLKQQTLQTLSDSLTTQSNNASADEPNDFLPMNNIYSDVGIGFQKYLSPELFVDTIDGNARDMNVQLLTVDGKEVFKTSWIKFDQSRLQLYGFPLQGNEDKHTFMLKATNSRGKSATQIFTVTVHSLPKIFNHYLEICMAVTLAEYAGNVEQRIRISRTIGNYIFPGIRIDDVWITKFDEGCITVVFRQLPARQKCDLKAINRIKEKIFNNGEINTQFHAALNGIAAIKTANVTLLKECKNKNETNKDGDLGWLRDVAPIFILLAVVAVPTLISCIVCKEVRRRQALMRQVQDRRVKEEKAQMLIQAAEYKHECGLDSDSEQNEEGVSRQKKQQNEEEYKFFGFSKIADIIIPEVVMDTVKHGTELLTTLLPQDSSDRNKSTALEAAQRKVSAMASLNPRNKLLDLSQEEELRKKKADMKKKGDTKVNKMVRFMKNPLEIKVFNFEENPTRVEKKKHQQLPMAISKTQDISTMLPNIGSIFNKLKSGYTGTISSTLRNKFELLLGSSSSFSSAETAQTSLSTNSNAMSNRTLEDIQEESIDEIKRFDREGMILEKGDRQNQMYRFVPRPGQSPSMKFGFDLQAGMVPILGDSIVQNLRSSPMKSNEDRENRHKVIESTVLHRIIDNGRRFFQGSTDVKRQADDIEGISCERIKANNLGLMQCSKDYKLEQHNAASLKEYEQYLEKDSFLKLEQSVDVENNEEQMYCLNYGITTNLKRDYTQTARMLAAKEIEQQRFPPRSDLSEMLVCRHVFDENDEFCYVNKPNQQLTTEPYGNLSSHACSNLNPEQLYSGVYDGDAHIENDVDGYIKSELHSYSYDGILEHEDRVVSITQGIARRKGLQHYDPISGEWCQSTKSESQFSEDNDMIDNRFLDEDLDNQWTSVEEDFNAKHSQLTWYDLNTKEMQYNQSYREKPGKQRRKTGLGLRIERGYNEDIPLMNYQEEIRERLIYEQREMPDLLNSQSQFEYNGFTRHCDLDYRNETLMERNSNFSTEQDCYGCVDTQEEYREIEESQDFQEMQQNSINRDHFLNYEDFMYRQHEIDWQRHRELSEEQEQRCSEGNFNTDRSKSNRFDETTMQLNNPLESSYLQTRHNEYQVNSDGFQDNRNDSQISLSTIRVASQDSSTQSEVDSTDRSSLSSNSRRERRRSVLERQYRVEIPEQSTSKQVNPPAMQLNPMFVIEEGQHPEVSGDRGHPDGDIDVLAANQSSRKHLANHDMRKPPYGDSFSQNEVEAEKILQQDADILEQQMRNYLKLNHQQPNFESEGPQILPNRRVEQLCGKRDELSGSSKRPGMRRFSTPSMESWTSTPEKYYYDATGENCISEEDIAREAIRNDKQKQSFIGRGRAREYTTRLLKGVSPKIRRHSTSVMGPDFTFSGNSGTFLGKIGEGKLVQTIQTKLGRKESRSEELKSPKIREKEKIEDDKNKGSPLNAIRNKLYLLSGGK